jgi:hypothetical protein
MENKAMKSSITLLKMTLSVTSLLIAQVYAAAPFSPDNQPLGHIGPIELSNDDLAKGAKAYRGWFENGGWQGDLIEYDVSSSGGLSTSIDLTSLTPEAGATATNWSALVQFAVNEAAAADYWDKGRKIITSNAGSQVAFRWPNLTAAQQKVLDLKASNDKAKEYTALAKLYALGLLVNSSSGEGTTGTLPPTGLDNISGSPVVIEGGVSEGGLTSGPNFNTGRRTWIDILPQ